MIILGLTGSVASGKSTVASWMAERQIAVFDADYTVHSLLSAGGKAVPEITVRFGQSVVATDGSIDRVKLGDHVFSHPEDRQALESILHPMVRLHRDQFLGAHYKKSSKIVVLDVPLLFETGVDVLCNYVIVVSAREETVWKRAIARPGMTEEKLSNILTSQMQAKEKCRRADFILDTDLDPQITRKHLFAWLDNLVLIPEVPRGDNNA